MRNQSVAQSIYSATENAPKTKSVQGCNWAQVSFRNMKSISLHDLVVLAGLITYTESIAPESGIVPLRKAWPSVKDLALRIGANAKNPKPTRDGLDRLVRVGLSTEHVRAGETTIYTLVPLEIGEEHLRFYRWLLADPRLSDAAKCVYAAIDHISQQGSRDCFAGPKYIAEMFGVSARTVERGEKELREVGLISLEIKKIKGVERKVYVMRPPLRIVRSSERKTKKTEDPSPCQNAQKKRAKVPSAPTRPLHLVGRDIPLKINARELALTKGEYRGNGKGEPSIGW